MEFENLNYMSFLIIPILILLIMLLGTKKRVGILEKLQLSNRKQITVTKIILMFIGSILAFISLLSPQKLLENKEVEVKNLNIYALIDVSRSMMAEDVFPNRLEKSKSVLKSIISSLGGDKIGFIPFSDTAYIQMPLTDDYTITTNYINAIDSKLISGGGTELLQALTLAEKSFKKIGTKEKVVLILSDGGEQDKKSLNFAKEHNITVFSIGIGTTNGGIIPIYNGTQKIGFIKENNGSAVITKLNSAFLKELSDKTHGKYYEVNNLIDNSRNFNLDIKSLNPKDSSIEKIRVYEKYYQYPLFVALVLILIASLLKERVKYEE